MAGTATTRLVRNITRVDVLGAGGALALTLLVFIGALQPSWARNREAGGRAKIALGEQRHLATLQLAVHTLQGNISDSQGKLSTDPVRILPQSALNLRLADLASLLSECNLAVNGVKPGEAAKLPRYIAVPIHLTGEGNYRDCSRFIGLLHARFVDIRLCAFGLVGTPGEPNHPSTFDLELCWLADPTPATPSQIFTAGVSE